MDISGHVKHSSADGISTVEFYHPRGNSMPGELLRSLATSIRAAHSDPTSKVIILRSAGEGPFCAGASFDELKSIRDLESGERFFSGFAEVILAMIRGRKPVVARVHGKAVGGGVGLVAASDYPIATNGSALRLSEIALGIGPFTIGPVVERKVGPGPFSGAALSGDWRSAEWGLQKGIYQELCPTVVALDEAVENLGKN
jgi:methylglutaconyl-CoA hydratase